MSEELLDCPLVTPYTTACDISADTLGKLYTVRNWDVEKDGSIPFKWPQYLRKNIYDLSRGVESEALSLREYQKQAIHHLCRMPRFLLGDAVGLGKTLDAIVATCWLKERFKDAKLVVVTTKSTTYQWEEEITRYSYLQPYVMRDTYKGLKSSNARYAQMIAFLEGTKKDALIVKYTSLIGTRKAVKKDEGFDGEFDANGDPITKKKENLSEEIRTFSKIFKQHGENVILVFDECHKFKTMGSSTRNLVFNISRHAGRVWALTATAIKNDLNEMYAIASGIRIEPLGFQGDFQDEFCIYREQWMGTHMEKFLVGYQNIPRFKNAMRPFFLGRSQRQVKEPLPELTTLYHPIELDARQTEILTDELPNGTIQLPPTIIKVAGEVYERERDPSNLMTQLSVQQLVTNHWCLLDRTDTEKFHTKTLSPKEEALLDLLDGDYRGEKVIVYTKYRTWIDRLQWLTENGKFTERKFLRITGAENEKQRNENKKKFQDPNSGYDMIVINAAGMEGINLQQAAHMVMMDMPWSWGDLIQLVGRMVRMASPHSACTLHVMVARGTIDEYTIETLKGKKGVFEKILGESHSAGILDSGDRSLDLGSGMDAEGTEEEFKELLRAHVKKVGMKTFLIGDLISEAKGNEDYKMAFEKGGKKAHKKKSRAEQNAEDEKLKSRWDVF